ncbi:hypothetical protein JYU34_013472 [Plutella xylostella]|uniref:Fasciclin-2 n=1 Tax=Plutella xylostella TaxID=51655 RepID=A0ABQ7Q9V6_PLUXY|nr:hypothetical protein JYU34_013472 [Plutella xylostella]
MQRFSFVCVATALFFGKVTHSCFTYDQHQSIIIKTGSSFYQECHCIEPGASVNNLKWIDPSGHEIQEMGLDTKLNVYTEKQARSISLHIPQLSKTISGPYQCVTTHQGKKYSSTFLIEAYDPAYFVNTTRKQYIIAGQDSMVHCHARGETEPLITWYKEGEEDESVQIVNNDKYEVQDRGLKIKRVTDNDNGTYKCTASVLDTGEEVDRLINVEVILSPIIEEIRVTPNTSVVVGTTVTIECIADGFPHPEYIWTKTSEKVPSENITWDQDINAITFESIEPSDQGKYECKASNIAGESKKEVSIEVLLPPTILEFSNVTALEGSTVQVVCRVSGRPVPDVKLIPNSPEILTDTDIIFDHKIISETENIIVVTFTLAKRSYEGVYYCNASNEVDSAEEEMYVDILYKPHFEIGQESIWGWIGKSVNLSCEFDSDPPGTIEWRFQGNDVETDEQVAINKLLNPDPTPELFVPFTIDRKSLFGIYECIAKNEHGKSKKSITIKEAFAPPVIDNVKLKEITASSVTFDIRGPNITEGPGVVGYTTEYDEEENYKITSIHRNRTWSVERPYRVEKLKPRTKYFFKFAAINVVGVGAWSESVTVVTLERTVPDPPIWEEEVKSMELKAEAIGNVLKWKVPDSDDPIDTYYLKYCPVQNENVNILVDLCKEQTIAPSSQINLDYLEQNTTYYIELIAHNAQGNSSAADLYMKTAAREESTSPLTAEGMIGLSLVVVVLCILALDLVLLCWRRQGLIASCYYRKKKNRNDDNLMSRDKKGLLRDSGIATAADDTLKKSHQEFEYNKTTGVITGKHSSV